MADHPNADVFKRAYTAFAAGDFEALAEVFDEHVVWHNPGRNPISGDYRGRDAAFASFAKEFELSGGTYRPEIHDVLSNDDRTGVRPDARFLVRQELRRSGRDRRGEFLLGDDSGRFAPTRSR